MIYPTTYINRVIATSYCCMGSLGTKINNLMLNGDDFSLQLLKLKQIFLLVFLIENYSQSSNGLIAGEDNIITTGERDLAIQAILKLCNCSNSSLLTMTNELAATIIGTDRWDDGVSDNDIID